MKFTCRGCLKTDRILDQMKKEKGLMARNRGICKSCVSIYETNKRYERMANNNPEDMLSCGNCDRFFYKYQSGPKTLDGRRLLRVDCPHCKSEEIEKVG